MCWQVKGHVSLLTFLHCRYLYYIHSPREYSWITMQLLTSKYLGKKTSQGRHKFAFFSPTILLSLCKANPSPTPKYLLTVGRK